jgi:hypothetical protein
MKIPRTALMLVFAIVSSFSSCKFVKYSFTGASISPNVKTYSVRHYPNLSDYPDPSVADAFTNALRDKFGRETSLTNLRTNGDIHFEGEITGYQISYDALRSDDTPAMTKLTITVRVVFENKDEPLKSFDKPFSDFATIDSGLPFDSSKDAMAEEIIIKLVDKIFLESVANW